LSLAGALKLPKGKANLVLKITGEDGAKEGAIELLSIELVRTDVEKQLRKRADAFRSQADTRSFRSAKYGLMFHWHTWTAPRHGPLLPYAEAVRNFKVEPFVEQVLATVAGPDQRARPHRGNRRRPQQAWGETFPLLSSGQQQ